MKRTLLSVLATVLFLHTFSQCMITPNAGTYIMSPLTVGSNYTLNGTSTYPAGKAFFICQGTILTLQNRAGADTFYVSTGAKLIGFEANAFNVFVKSGATYDAANSGTAIIYYETGSNIVNYTSPMFPPCPSLTFNMTLIGPNACTTTNIAEQSNSISNVFVSPNPAHYEISVSSFVISDQLGICIYDMIGNKILEKSNVSNQTNINITSLPSGIYFIRVMNGEENVGVQKFVKY